MLCCRLLPIKTSPGGPQECGYKIGPVAGYSAEGGAVGGGVQWIGVASYNKLVYNIIQITTPCFHCTPL